MLTQPLASNRQLRKRWRRGHPSKQVTGSIGDGSTVARHPVPGALAGLMSRPDRLRKRLTIRAQARTDEAAASRTFGDGSGVGPQSLLRTGAANYFSGAG
ncbi:hypothetical protein PHYPSEUDO_000016 [Phytophthora pseudosyringae]|uniref:Uncharacterized protein n=1 Tax=Phytophthora pseudosyringae TaxID=221518 RepID=A0A8T1WQ46_9STRA|nr:hypothetical protein PHYPSEUDO_000016 [Phytophthora pseudosyringae]